MKVIFTLMLVLAAMGVNAQVTTSAISGKVTDEQNETVIGATVIAVHEPSGTQYGAVTNVDGRYTMQGMRTGGPYKLTVSYVGYQSAAFTGIMLDKWFLTPMSVFFRFIRPIAFTPMQFYPLVNTLASLILMEHNVGAELFTPPTYYSLTALGKELFADPDIIDVDKQQMPQTMPYEQLQAAVLQEAEAQEQELLFLTEVVPDVLSLKISQSGDADLWKIIEVGQDMDVNVLCRDLCGAFALEDMADYLLSVPDRNGFPLEYSANGSKRSLNKANGKMLQELPLSVGTTLLLYPTHSRAAYLRLEILEKGKGNPYLMYPRVTEQSPKMIELEKMDELF